MAIEDIDVLESVATDFAHKHGLAYVGSYRPLHPVNDGDGNQIPGSVDHERHKYLRFFRFFSPSKVVPDHKVTAWLNIDIREDTPEELIQQRCVAALISMEETERFEAEVKGIEHSPRWITDDGKMVVNDA